MTLIRDLMAIKSFMSLRKPYKKFEFDKADGALTLRILELHQYEGMARLMLDGNGKELRLPGSFYPSPSSPFRMKPYCVYRMTTQILLHNFPKNVLAIIDPFNLEGMCSFPSIVKLPSCEEARPLVLSFFALRQVEVVIGFPVLRMHLYLNEDGGVFKDENETSEPNLDGEAVSNGGEISVRGKDKRDKRRRS